MLFSKLLISVPMIFSMSDIHGSFKYFWERVCRVTPLSLSRPLETNPRRPYSITVMSITAAPDSLKENVNAGDVL
jgi:hypothetical protein